MQTDEGNMHVTSILLVSCEAIVMRWMEMSFQTHLYFQPPFPSISQGFPPRSLECNSKTRIIARYDPSPNEVMKNYSLKY